MLRTCLLGAMVGLGLCGAARAEDAHVRRKDRAALISQVTVPTENDNGNGENENANNDNANDDNANGAGGRGGGGGACGVGMIHLGALFVATAGLRVLNGRRHHWAGALARRRENSTRPPPGRE